MPEMYVEFNSRLAKGLAVLSTAFAAAGPAEAAVGLSCPSFSGRAGLRQVEISDGPPSEQAFLAPDVTVEGKEGFTNRWVLGPSKRDYWARCTYGPRTIVDIRLPHGLRQCTIRYDSEHRVIRDGLQPSCR